MIQSKIGPISIVLVLLLLAAGQVSAGLSVGGSVLDKEVAPGSNFKHVMNVQTRSSDQPMDIRVELLGYGQNQYPGGIALNASEDTSPYTARPFLEVSPNSFHLDPGKSQQVTLEGNIPNDVGSGGRYSIVKIYSLPPKQNGSIAISLAVEVPIRLTISGSEILKKGEIENINPVEPISSEKQKASFVFKNTGNIHYKPAAEIVIKDKEGSIMANASTLQETLLPTYSRLFMLDLTPKTALKPGTYNLNATVSTDGKVLATKETSFEVKS